MKITPLDLGRDCLKGAAPAERQVTVAQTLCVGGTRSRVRSGLQSRGADLLAGDLSATIAAGRSPDAAAARAAAIQAEQHGRTFIGVMPAHVLRAARSVAAGTVDLAKTKPMFSLCDPPALRAPAATRRPEAAVREQVAAAPQPTAAEPQPPAAASVQTPPPLRRVNPASHLFRQQALLAYQRGAQLSAVLRLTTPGAWAFLGALGLSVLSALLLGVFCKVSVTAEGRGILRTPGGAQVLNAAIGGKLERLYVQSGAQVQAGQPLLALDATSLRAELEEASRQLDAAAQRLRATQARQAQHERTLALLHEQVQLASQRLRSEQESLPALERRRSAYQELRTQGFVSAVSLEDIHERIRDVQRSRIRTEQELASTHMQEVELQRQRDDELRRADAEVQTAAAHKAAVETMLTQTTLHAPAAGRVEGLIAKLGDRIAEGQALAELMPSGPPSQVVAFVDDRDRAFVKRGARVRVEVDQLPLAEFGALYGEVRTLDTHFVAPSERLRELGEREQWPAPSYRVEIALDATPDNQTLLQRLSSGSSVTAHFNLRKRRVIALAFEPVAALLHSMEH